MLLTDVGDKKFEILTCHQHHVICHQHHCVHRARVRVRSIILELDHFQMTKSGEFNRPVWYCVKKLTPPIMSLQEKVHVPLIQLTSTFLKSFINRATPQNCMTMTFFKNGSCQSSADMGKSSDTDRTRVFAELWFSLWKSLYIKPVTWERFIDYSLSR